MEQTFFMKDVVIIVTRKDREIALIKEVHLPTHNFSHKLS